MHQLVTHKRARPGQDVISDLITAQSEGHYGDDQVAALAATLLFAGYETTVTRIDYGALLQLTHPTSTTPCTAIPSWWQRPLRRSCGWPPPAVGPRFCIGAGLARLELHAVFAALLRRFPALDLAVPLDQLRLRGDLLTGGLATLPVTW